METAAGTITYQVDSVTTYVKSTLKDSPVWDMVPNRLVLISCYTEDPWGKNVVVTASPQRRSLRAAIVERAVDTRKRQAEGTC